MFKLELTRSGEKSIVLYINEDREVLEKKAEEMGWAISDEKDNVWFVEVNEMSYSEEVLWEDLYEKVKFMNETFEELENACREEEEYYEDYEEDFDFFEGE